MADPDQSPVRERYKKTYRDVTKWIDEARSFWRTRRAILQGQSLWDLDTAQLESEKYFGPWKFNAVQTAIAGALAAATTKVLNLVVPKLGSSEPKPFRDDPALAKLFEVTSGWIEPFVLPIVLTSFVVLMGWGSLKGAQSTSATRARARAAYLYLDGAHGFWPQLTLALLLAAKSVQLPARLEGYFAAPFVLWPLQAIFLVLFVWQIYITAGKIPRLLFAANGYSARARRFWQPGKSDDPPWGKLVAANLLASGPLLFTVTGGAFVLEYGLARALRWLQSLVG